MEGAEGAVGAGRVTDSGVCDQVAGGQAHSCAYAERCPPTVRMPAAGLP